MNRFLHRLSPNNKTIAYFSGQHVSSIKDKLLLMRGQRLLLNKQCKRKEHPAQSFICRTVYSHSESNFTLQYSIAPEVLKDMETAVLLSVLY